MRQEEARSIRELYKQGKAVKDISKEFRVSISMVYSVLRNESNHDPAYTFKRRLKVDSDAAWKLYKQGKTYGDISKELSTEAEFISPSLIGHHVRKKWEEEELK
ncbi:MAG: hypothetical protein HOB29_09425 [Planctomycetaceae bacterium]|jgi:hypothetical protein|nr:hypothetical protein [Planctomycetaceae bacterium]